MLVYFLGSFYIIQFIFCSFLPITHSYFFQPRLLSTLNCTLLFVSEWIHFLGFSWQSSMNWVASNNKFVVSDSWRLEVWNQSINRVASFWRTCLSPHSRQRCNPWSSLVCGCITPISASTITWLSPCMSLSKLPSSYKDANHWIRTHLNLVRPHFSLLHL